MKRNYEVLGRDRKREEERVDLLQQHFAMRRKDQFFYHSFLQQLTKKIHNAICNTTSTQVDYTMDSLSCESCVVSLVVLNAVSC